MMPSQLNDLSKLDWQDQHWIEVLVKSARVERIIAPTWAELIRGDRLDNWSENQEGIATELSCRFGLHKECIFCAILEGLRGSNCCRNICSTIADYVGPSTFSYSFQVWLVRTNKEWWRQIGSISIKRVMIMEHRTSWFEIYLGTSTWIEKPLGHHIAGTSIMQTMASIPSYTMHQHQPQNGHKITQLSWTCTTTAVEPPWKR